MTVSLKFVKNTEGEPGKRTLQKLDLLDIKILRALIQGQAVWTILGSTFRKPIGSISRQLGIDEDTVRNRIKRMEKSGFLHSWNILVNPRALGYEEGIAWFDVPYHVSKSDLIAKLKLVPDIFVVVDYYGTMTLVMFRYDSPGTVPNRIKLLQKLSQSDRITWGQTPWPECNLKLSRTDWEIISSLHRDPRKTHRAVSEEMGVSARTVDRRLDRMIKSNVIYAFPSLGLPSLEGTMLADLGITYPTKNREQVFRQVTGAVEDCLWHIVPGITLQDGIGEHTWFELALPNISRAGQLREWAQTLRGIDNVRVELKQSHSILLDVLDGYYQKKLLSLGQK